jgi:glucose-1-phosphate adenylyltransferase
MQDYRPDRVLVLSGDHIYRMDYEPMIAAHEAHGADLTIAAMPVPWEETQRFGVMIIGAGGWITDFQEKVPHAKSNMASMGIYVFNFAVLEKELLAVVASRKGYDFGKDIIPGMLGRRKLLCYPFTGYWRDVGTIKSYHEANMDCLDPSSGLDLEAWQLRTAPEFQYLADRPPAVLGNAASVSNALIARGCRVDGEVEHSILFPGVRVERAACVRDSIVLQDAVIGSGSRIKYAIIDKHCVLGPGSLIGMGKGGAANRQFPSHLDCGITLIGKGAVLPEQSRVGKNCILYPGVNLVGRVKEVGDGETIME